MPPVGYQALPTIDEEQRVPSEPWPRTPYPFGGIALLDQPQSPTSGSTSGETLETDISTTPSLSDGDTSVNDPEVLALTPALELSSGANDGSRPQILDYESPQHWPSNSWGYEYPAGSVAPDDLGDRVLQNSWNREQHRHEQPRTSGRESAVVDQQESCIEWLENVTCSVGEGLKTLAPTLPDNSHAFGTTECFDLGGTVIPKACDLQNVGILPDPRNNTSRANEHATEDGALQMLASVASTQDYQGRLEHERKRNRAESRAERSDTHTKRPRLVRGSSLNKSSWSIPVSGPAPTSPERCFTEVLAEKPTVHGNMYKVVWRESWVHESRLPSIPHLRELQFARTGRHWDVLPMSPTYVRSE